MKYRKKPIVVDAIQLTSQSIKECLEFIENNWHSVSYGLHCYINIYTLEGVMRADVNDYIIKGIKGEFYPCKPYVFEASYEAVE